MKKLALVVGILVVVAAGTLALRARGSRGGGELTERLGVCGDRPNCVSSQEAREEFRVEPLTVSGSADDAFERAREAVESLPRTRVVVSEAGYLHAECTTALFGFVDDLELELDSAAGVIHIRSASREGYSDLGVNRKRVERIRAAF